MRVANASGRLVADTGDGFADVERASEGRFGPSQGVYDDWDAFSAWAGNGSLQGDPDGVGARRDPPRFLRDGDELVSRIDGVGEIFQTFHDNEKGQAA
jgi:hypothetical protein